MGPCKNKNSKLGLSIKINSQRATQQRNCGILAIHDILQLSKLQRWFLRASHSGQALPPGERGRLIILPQEKRGKRGVQRIHHGSTVISFRPPNVVSSAPHSPARVTIVDNRDQLAKGLRWALFQHMVCSATPHQGCVSLTFPPAQGHFSFCWTLTYSSSCSWNKLLPQAPITLSIIC